MRIDVLATNGRAAPQWVSIEAESPAHAQSLLAGRGMSALATRSAGFLDEIAGSRAVALLPWAGRRRFDLDIFCAQLVVLLKAGLGVVESLRVLRSNARHALQRETMIRLLLDLDQGLAFSDALARHPFAFPPLFVAIIRASERTSGLVDALSRYAAHARQVDEVRAKLRSAAVYPVFLSLIGGLVIAFLLGYVVPRFASAYESVHVPLPVAARWMMKWGQLIRDHAGLMVLGLMGCALAFGLLLSRSGIRQWLSARLVRRGTLGEFLRRIHLARLYRTLAMLLSGGIALHPSLRICRSMLPADLQIALDVAAVEVAQGSRPSQAFDDAALVTPVSFNLMAVGERSGQLAAMLDESASFLELESTRTLDATMRVIEPALMAVMGLVIGVIVVLMYLPIFELAGSVR